MPHLPPPPQRKAPRPARGVVHGGKPAGTVEHDRALPAPDLAPFVAHFWWVRWSLRAPFQVETLPHPTVHILFESVHARAGARATRKAIVQGIPTRRFVRRLAGEGFVFGIKFRPAMFQPLLGKPVASLTNAHLYFGGLFAREGANLARAIIGAASMSARMDLAETFLRNILPSVNSAVTEVRDLVERMAIDRTFLRADQAADCLGLDLRTLQRRFRQYVGVGPKWVLQRYRLHEAAERLKQPKPPGLADLAASLGYFDQAHFAREFKAIVGRTPSDFVAAIAKPTKNRSASENARSSVDP